MYDFIVYLCGHGDTKDETAWCLCELCLRSKYNFEVRYKTGDAGVGRDRSIVLTEFLKRNDSNYMIFIDTDMVFDPLAVEEIYRGMMAKESVVAGAYGVRDGSFLAINVPGGAIWDGRIVEAKYVSTGFMGVPRSTLIKVRDELNLTLLHEGDWCECYAFCESGHLTEEPIYISEDWNFCWKVHKVGLKVYLHTGVVLDHVKKRIVKGRETLQNMANKERQPSIAEEFVVQSMLVSDLADFLDKPEKEVFKKINDSPAEVVAQDFREYKGSDFYRDNKSYIYDLANFNQNPHYWTGRIAPLMDLKDKYILDIGCGIGSAAIQLARHRNKVVGYDVNQYLIDFCNFRKAKFGLDVKFTTERPDVSKFDYVLAIDVLEHIEDLEGFLKSLNMKSEARLYHTDVFETNGNYPMHFDHSESIDKWLNDAGFIVVDKNWAIKR